MLPHQYNPETDPQEAARAAGVMLRTGTVKEVDVARALVRFETGGITTDWLPWFERRAGGERGGRSWWPPVKGEQGMLLAPGGDLARAVILPGMFSDAMPAASRQAGTAREDWDDRDFWEWAGGALTVRCTNEVTITVGESSIRITQDAIEMKAGGATLQLAGGIVRASADVRAGRISLVNHVHGGVQTGLSTTREPQ